MTCPETGRERGVTEGGRMSGDEGNGGKEQIEKEKKGGKGGTLAKALFACAAVTRFQVRVSGGMMMQDLTRTASKL